METAPALATPLPVGSTTIPKPTCKSSSPPSKKTQGKSLPASQAPQMAPPPQTVEEAETEAGEMGATEEKDYGDEDVEPLDHPQL